MQNQRKKLEDPRADSHDSLYQLVLQQQQQDAHFRLGLTGNLRANTPFGLAGGYSLPNFPSMASLHLDYSRQQLLNSMIAAEQQRHLAIRERIALHQGMQFTRADTFIPTIHSSPQEAPVSGIQGHSININDKKRSYEETRGPAVPEVHEEVKAYPEAEEVSQPMCVSSDKAVSEEADTRLPLMESSEKPVSKKKPPPKKRARKGEVTTPAEPKKDTKWLLMLEELKDYKSKYGNCIVPRGYAPNPRLASWVAEQR